MYKTEIKQVTERKEVITHVVCDTCKKEVLGFKLPDNWHKISAHHHEWDEYHHESCENYFVCGPGCYKIKLKEVVEDFKEYESAEVDGMTIEFAKLMVEFLDK